LLSAEIGKPATEVFTGGGKVTSEAAEIRRLHREVQTLRIEPDFQNERLPTSPRSLDE
jgi:hypothetical protein